MPQENLFISYLKRDLVVSFRGKSASLNPLIFFVMIVLLMPLSLGSYSLALQKVAPGIIWIMALLSVLLSAGSIFDEDYNDGSLEQMIITPNLLFLPLLGKMTAHWISKSLPIAITAPFLGLFLPMPENALIPLLVGLIIAACFTLLGSIGAALNRSDQRQSFLLALIILPLYVPIIIFGSSVIYYMADGMNWRYPLAALSSIFCILVVLSPLAISGIFRSSMIE